MAMQQGIRLKSPAHPGGFVKTEIIEALELTVTDAAFVLDVTRSALSNFLNEKSHLSPEMALRLEKVFGVSMDTLMRMQTSYDIAQARKRASKLRCSPLSKFGSSSQDEKLQKPKGARNLLRQRATARKLREAGG